MPRLEYRLLDKVGEYPILFYYQDIDETEIAARFVCDYFVKNAMLYERQSCAMEPLKYIIYVKKAEDEMMPYYSNADKHKKNIYIEVRKFNEDLEEYPLVFTYQLKEHKEALLYLASDFFMWSGEEWQKTSAEIDEDRKVYVIYAKPCEVTD